MHHEKCIECTPSQSYKKYQRIGLDKLVKCTNHTYLSKTRFDFKNTFLSATKKQTLMQGYCDCVKLFLKMILILIVSTEHGNQN